MDNIQDLTDLLLTYWCQVPQHTFWCFDGFLELKNQWTDEAKIWSSLCFNARSDSFQHKDCFSQQDCFLSKYSSWYGGTYNLGRCHNVMTDAAYRKRLCSTCPFLTQHLIRFTLGKCLAECIAPLTPNSSGSSHNQSVVGLIPEPECPWYPNSSWWLCCWCVNVCLWVSLASAL